MSWAPMLSSAPTGEIRAGAALSTAALPHAAVRPPRSTT